MVRKLRVEDCALILKVLWISSQCFQRHPCSSHPFEVFHLVQGPAITWGFAQSSTWEGEDSMSLLWDQSLSYVNLRFAWNYLPTTGHLGTDVTDVKVWLQFGRHLCHPERNFMNTLIDLFLNFWAATLAVKQNEQKRLVTPGLWSVDHLTSWLFGIETCSLRDRPEKFGRPHVKVDRVSHSIWSSKELSWRLWLKPLKFSILKSSGAFVPASNSVSRKRAVRLSGFFAPLKSSSPSIRIQQRHGSAKLPRCHVQTAKCKVADIFGATISSCFEKPNFSGERSVFLLLQSFHSFMQLPRCLLALLPKVSCVMCRSRPKKSLTAQACWRFTSHKAVSITGEPWLQEEASRWFVSCILPCSISSLLQLVPKLMEHLTYSDVAVVAANLLPADVQVSKATKLFWRVFGLWGQALQSSTRVWVCTYVLPARRSGLNG